MIDDPQSARAYDPASMATSSLSTMKAVWYKRPWVLITFAIVVIVGVSVITDLPHPISIADDVAAQNSAMKDINSDLKSCAFAVNETFNFYRHFPPGHVSASHLKVINLYLVNDQTPCSFAGPGMSLLTNNLQISDTSAGKEIEKVRTLVATWMDSDANGAIADIAYLYKHPGDAKTLKDLASRQKYLESDRQSALGYLARADAILAVQLRTLNLPTLGVLPGV